MKSLSLCFFFFLSVVGCFAQDIPQEEKEMYMIVKLMDGEALEYAVSSISEIIFEEKACSIPDEESPECLQLRQYINEKWPYYFTPSSDEPDGGSGYLDQKIASIPKGKHFVFITDTHWKDNPAKRSTIIAEYVSKRLGGCMTVFGGDAVNNAANKTVGATELSAYADPFFNAFGDNALWVCGNHDANYAAVNSGKSSASEGLIDDEEIYRRTVAKIAHLVTFDKESIAAIQDIGLTDEQQRLGEAWLRLHYYRDNPAEKIRYVVFETGNGGLATRTLVRAGVSWMIPLQFAWFYRVLMSTPDDYDIVVLGHEWTATSGDSDACNMLMMLYNFKKKASVKVNMRQQNTTNGTVFARALCGTAQNRTFNFKASSWRGRIFVVGGHFHRDRIFAHKGDLGMLTLYPHSEAEPDMDEDAVISIITNTDNPTRDNINKGVRPTTTGTTDEVCFDVITITDDDRLVITRIGYGEDREVRLP